MKLRDYQNYAVESIFNYWASGKSGNPVVAMPTGTGKSPVIGDFVRRALMVYPGTRVMMLTHVKELIEQNFDKLLRIWPTAPAGIYSAGLKRKDRGLPITFAGIKSVVDCPELFEHIDLLLIDECHLVSPKETTQYQKFITALKKRNPYLKVVGFTATHYRLGMGFITDEGGMFDDLCVDMTTMESFNWFIDEGYLVPLIPKPTAVRLDTTGVGTSGGEFKPGELQLAVNKEEVTRGAIIEMMRYGSDRKKWLVFASGIDHTIDTAKMMLSFGIPTTYVHSKMSDGERDENIRKFRAGHYVAMVNNGILTTGFDDPTIDLIGMLRPTKSTSLWVQMLGRGTRPLYAPGFDLETKNGRLGAIAASGRPNCLVLDFARNVELLGPINDPVLPRAKGKGGGGAAPIRLCDHCGTYNHASARYCVSCGVEFPRGIKIQTAASTSELLRRNSQEEEAAVVETIPIERVVYKKHQKPGSEHPTLRVEYYAKYAVYREWVCLEHDRLAGKKARDWWRERSGFEDTPATIDEALESLDALKTPRAIRVWTNAKPFPTVMGAEY